MDSDTVRESILLTVKKMIGGLDEENDHFDVDLITIINSTFMVLCQLGVGPETPYRIEGADNTWSEFECLDLESVKEYMFLKTKMIFDPPSNGTAASAYEQRAAELEWRLQIFSEELKDAE